MYGHDALDIAAFSEVQRPQGAKFLMLDEENMNMTVTDDDVVDIANDAKTAAVALNK